MFMHYWGGGVGHQAVREATNSFLNDRPLEELRARDKAATAQRGDDPQAATKCESEAEDEGEGEGEGEEIEAEINQDDIHDGDASDEIIDDDNQEEAEEEDEDTESDHDESDEEEDAAPDISEYADF
jgi:hypothetical protein